MYEIIPSGDEHSFHTSKCIHKYLNTPWHYHPEYEILYIKHGTGTRYVGNNISSFEPGEILLLGPNLPHVWRNDEKYYSDDFKENAEVWVCHFLDIVLGDSLLKLHEFKKVNEMLIASSKGVLFRFQPEIIMDFEKKFETLIYANGLHRMIGLLELFDILIKCNDYELLNSNALISDFPAESEKMQQIYQFVTKNYKQEISLEQAASLVHMSVTNFCRYFKRMNNKTFMEYVNEVRIYKACQMLRESTLSVTEICYESGFNNFSNFSRHFKNIKKRTPKQYRARFWHAA